MTREKQAEAVADNFSGFFSPDTGVFLVSVRAESADHCVLHVGSVFQAEMDRGKAARRAVEKLWSPDASNFFRVPSARVASVFEVEDWIEDIDDRWAIETRNRICDMAGEVGDDFSETMAMEHLSMQIEYIVARGTPEQQNELALLLQGVNLCSYS